MLSCSSNKLTSLDVSKNTALTRLSIIDNQLTSLDVSKNTALTILMSHNNLLTSLNVANGNNTNFRSSGIYITHYFEATGNPDLRCIQVDDVDYSNMYWADNKDENAYYSTNCGTLTTKIPDINFERALIDLGIDSGEIDGVVLTAKISGITSLNVSNKSIESLDGIEDFTALTFLGCVGNQLTSLDVSKNTALTALACSSNQLTSLDVTKNTALSIFLGCRDNKLTSLDISKNTDLTILTCAGNQLSELDVSKNTALTLLYCGNNQLTSLNVSENTALTRKIHQKIGIMGVKRYL